LATDQARELDAIVSSAERWSCLSKPPWDILVPAAGHRRTLPSAKLDAIIEHERRVCLVHLQENCGASLPSPSSKLTVAADHLPAETLHVRIHACRQRPRQRAHKLVLKSAPKTNVTLEPRALASSLLCPQCSLLTIRSSANSLSCNDDK